jgi:ribosomal protein RSM22 (predicted rRNA methylase)
MRERAIVNPTRMQLRAAIDAELQGVRLRALHDASEALSARYRDGAPTGARAMSELERLAYLTVRMPATYAAIGTVLDETCRALAPTEVRTLLDLGSGAGAALWAAADAWPTLARATLVDADEELLALGARVWRAHPQSAGVRVDPRRGRLDRLAGEGESGGEALRLSSADLVTISYVLGELEPAAAGELVRQAFNAARLALVIVEPGTPRGYAQVIEARTRLLELGARIAAPCPHADPCPLTGDDWCHFAVRLERSRAHRQLKGAELAWEDEKLSYLVVVRGDVQPAEGRILRRPLIDKGRISLRVCTPEGIVDTAVTRRDAGMWRAARHARWGGVWGTDASSMTSDQ